MSEQGDYLAQAAALFSGRARQIKDPSDRRWLSFASGRDPDLWSDQLYGSLVKSIVDQLQLDRSHSLLELGSAAGFLIPGLAAHVHKYFALDASKAALEVVRGFEPLEVSTLLADARSLPLKSESCSRILCYDVITNFPDWSSVESLVREAQRVMTHEGIFLLGSIPDVDKRVEIEDVANRIYQAGLLGDVRASGRRPRWLQFTSRKKSALVGLGPDEGSITCHYFDRSRFHLLAANHGLAVELHEIHRDNPYYGLRFNAIFRKGRGEG